MKITKISQKMPHIPKGKILCITSNFPRWKGDSTTPFVLNLSEDLQKLGWDVDVLAPHAKGTALKEVMNGIQVRRFPYLWPYSLETICYQGGALINLRKHKTNYLKLPFLIGSEWFNTLYQLKKGRYDLLHSHWILPQGFCGIFTAKILKIPHVLTVHGGDIFGLQNKFFTKIKKQILNNVDAVTVNSSVTEKAVCRVAQGEKKPYKIPMGISVDEKTNAAEVMAIKTKYKKGELPLLIFVGRVVGEKGIKDLIQAVDILKKTYPAISALVVGEGQDRNDFEILTRQLGLCRNIHFTGWIDPDEVKTYLSAGDIFIGPSRTAADGWIEAQGLTFIEAMEAKIPVIATRAGGIIDSVKHEKTGLLVEEQAPDQIAEAVVRLMNDETLKNTIVSNAYYRATTYFSREKSAQTFSALFDTLLKGH